MREEVITEEQEEPGVSIPSHTVDGTLASSNVVSTQEPEEEEQVTEDKPMQSPKRVFIPDWSSIIACILFCILVGEHVVPLVWPVLDSYFHPKAVVTLFAAKQRLQFTYTFLAVTGTADIQQHQIPSRQISFTTQTRSLSIPTTGIGYTRATQAKGEITFYNEAPYAQTIQAGIVVTGGSGIQVITDQSITIKAGNGVTNGSATVPAHTLAGGSIGNIQALDINGLCCIEGILAKNLTAFTGGTDPKAYPVVSSTDLEAAALQLTATLDPVARNGLQRQIIQTERSLTPLKCSYAATSSPKVGERATEAIVSVSETCQTQVYDNATLQEQASLLFLQDGEKHAGNNFTLSGSPTVALKATTLLDTSHHTYKLAVTASGTLIFHLSERQLQTLITLIAGKSFTQVQQELLGIQGVQGVAIQPARQGETTLPKDPSRIQIVIV
jgi:hypothetical protein